MANILLIDDKPGVRRLWGEELAGEGYTVLTTGDFFLVRQILGFSNLDLVIADIYVKGEHRWDLLLDMKRQDPHLPVLIVTDFASYRRDPRSSLAAGLLVRGFDFTRLLQKIAGILRGRQAPPYRVASDWHTIPVAPPYLLHKQTGIGSRKVLSGSPESLH
jgi:DNA-binding NtrC family response regulator